MDNKIIDSGNLCFNGSESRHLSYDLLFKDVPGFDNGYSETDSEDTASVSEERFRQAEKEWQQKLEEAKEKAYRQGLEAGIEEGQKQAVKLFSGHIKPVREAAEKAQEKIDGLIESLQPQLAAMVFDLAEKVLELPVHNERLQQRLSEELSAVLETLNADIKIQLTVCRSDYDHIKRHFEKIASARSMQIIPSDELNPGEYSVDTAKERIVKNFRKILADFREKVALTDVKENGEGVDGLC